MMQLNGHKDFTSYSAFLNVEAAIVSPSINPKSRYFEWRKKVKEKIIK